MANCFIDLPMNIKCFYKRKCINQITNCIANIKWLKIVNDFSDVKFIFCIINDVPKWYNLKKNELDNGMLYLVLLSYQDSIGVNNDILDLPYVIAFISAFKFTNDSDKIHPIMNISQYYIRQFQCNVKPISERKYDIVFLGSINFSNDKITNHRKSIYNKLLEIGMKNKLNYVISSSINIKDYYNILSETKLFISPRGYGEWSLKEYECICFGCHVIVPNGNIISYPNYYYNFDNFDNNIEKLEDLIINLLNDTNMVQEKVNTNRNLFLKYKRDKPIVLLNNILQSYN